MTTDSSDVCEVKRIAAKNSDGFTEINASDFDAKVHKEWVAPKGFVEPQPPVAPPEHSGGSQPAGWPVAPVAGDPEPGITSNTPQ